MILDLKHGKIPQVVVIRVHKSWSINKVATYATLAIILIEATVWHVKWAYCKRGNHSDIWFRSESIHTQDDCKTRFLNLNAIDILGKTIFCCGVILCIVRCWQDPLDISNTPSPSHKNKKCLQVFQILPKVPWGTESALVVNHWNKLYNVLIWFLFNVWSDFFKNRICYTGA